MANVARSVSRRVIILVKAGAPVDQTIDLLMEHMEPGDIIIDGGNEWCVLLLLWEHFPFLWFSGWMF